MPSDVVAPGVYDHYKGGKYTVLFVADDSTNSRAGSTVVVYMSLTYGKVHCRDLAEFVEPVAWLDGTTRPRFIKVDI
jgi:hypothetical protein